MDLRIKAKLLGINSYPNSNIKLFKNYNPIYQLIKKNILNNTLFFLKNHSTGGSLDYTFIKNNFKKDYITVLFKNKKYKIKMEVINDFGNQDIKDYLTENKELNKTLILYIGFKNLSDTPCAIVIIDETQPDFYEAIIQSIGKQELICDDGKSLMGLVIKFLKTLKVDRVILSDNSTIHISKNEKISLSKYYLLKTGKTWYEYWFNFKPIEPIYRPNLKVKLEEIKNLLPNEFKNYINDENKLDLLNNHISQLIIIYPKVIELLIPYSIKTDFELKLD